MLRAGGKRVFMYTLKDESRLRPELSQKLARSIGNFIDNLVDEIVAHDAGNETVEFENLRSMLDDCGVDDAPIVALKILQAGYARGSKDYPVSTPYDWLAFRQRACVACVPQFFTAGSDALQRCMILPAAWDVTKEDFRKLRDLAKEHGFDKSTIECLLNPRVMDATLIRLRDSCHNAGNDRTVTHGELFGMACAAGRWDRNGLAFQLKLIQQLYAQKGAQPPGYVMLSHPYTFVSLDGSHTVPLATVMSKLMVAHGTCPTVPHNAYASVLRSVHHRTFHTMLGRLPKQELEAREWLETVARSRLTSWLWALRPGMLYTAYAAGREDSALAAHHFSIIQADICQRALGGNNAGPFQWNVTTNPELKETAFPVAESVGDHVEWLLSEVRRVPWPLYMQTYVSQLILRATGVPQKKFSRFGVVFPALARSSWDSQGKLTEEVVEAVFNVVVGQTPPPTNRQKFAAEVHESMFFGFVELCTKHQTSLPLFQEVFPYFVREKTRFNGAKIKEQVQAIRKAWIIKKISLAYPGGVGALDANETTKAFQEDFPGIICMSDVALAMDRRQTFLLHNDVVGLYRGAVETPGFHYHPMHISGDSEREEILDEYE